MAKAKVSRSERARWNAEVRDLRSELAHKLGMFLEGSCDNPISAERDTVRALFAAYRLSYGEGYDVGTFLDFVLVACLDEGATNLDILEVYERRVRERVLHLSPEQLAAKPGRRRARP